MSPPTLLADHGLIITSCSREKLDTTEPVRALDLYQGACVPHLRARLGSNPVLRRRIRILSARHGLLSPDDRIASYDHKLADLAEAQHLRARVAPQLDDELAASPHLAEVLVIVEPLYFVALGSLLELDPSPRVRWIPDPWGWTQAAAVLDDWGWR